MNKKKIINDPLYGSISIDSELIFELIQHPYFQRLRYIKQLGLSNLVYPGAQHTRFHHALGSMQLMKCTLQTLRSKGVEINNSEQEAAQIAILLHDIGHGPLSHALEQTLLTETSHESLSYLFMKIFSQHWGEPLKMAMQFYSNSYPRVFFHELISSQLDMDRLDYLKRDSFYTGVHEGGIGVDRIISMLTVFNDQLVVEENGIFSIEHFLHARRLMYWQVYLHKTAVSAERMMINIIQRAQYLFDSGERLAASEALIVFLKKSYSISDFSLHEWLIEAFGQLDDNDIWGALKLWKDHPDQILSGLCNRLLTRDLFQISLRNNAIKKMELEEIRQRIRQEFGVSKQDARYFFSYGYVSNEAYVTASYPINILTKSGQIVDVTQLSELPSIKSISKIVSKNYLCWPKNISLPNTY